MKRTIDTMKKITYIVLAIVLNCVPNLLAAVDVQQTGNLFVLSNEKVALTIDLEKRRLAVTDVATGEVVLDNAFVAADNANLFSGKSVEQVLTLNGSAGAEAAKVQPGSSR